MAGPWSTNNPGIGGLEELTAAEEALVESIGIFGTAGQVLAVNATTDGVEWITVSGSGDMTAAVYDPAAKAEQVLTIGDRTGADAGVVSGTVGTDGFLSKWNVDGDLVGSVLSEDRSINQMSTGLLSGGALSINVTTTLFDVAAGSGEIIDNTDPDNPVVTNVSWTAFTAQTVTNLATQPVTYISINSAGAIVQETALPDATDRRTNIFLGVLVHSNNTNIEVVNNIPVVGLDVNAQLQDLMNAIGFFSVSGNIVSPNGANLSINKEAGVAFKAGANFQTTASKPHEFPLAAITLATFRYRDQLSVEGTDRTTIDPTTYDNAGVNTAVPAAANSTIQRVFIFPSNVVRIQKGQEVFSNLATAVGAAGAETFVTESNIAENGLYLGSIVVRKDATDLSDPSQARIILSSGIGSAVGSTSTLQTSYDASTTPEIITDSTRGAVTIQRGSAADTDNIVEGKNGAGTQVAYITGKGKLGVTEEVITVADTANVVGLTINQNDVTNSPNALDIVVGSGYGLYLQRNDNSTNPVSSAFYKNSTSPAANDEILDLNFLANNSVSAITQFAQLNVGTEDPTNTSEDGYLEWFNISAGTKRSKFKTKGSLNGVEIGDSAVGAGILQSRGNQDLKLQTGNTTTGNITITDGAGGDISVSPNYPGAVNLGGLETNITSGNMAGLSYLEFANLSGNVIAGPAGTSILELTQNTSAVNEITIANASTGNAPSVGATGGDTNIDLELIPKGTGDVVISASDIRINNAQSIVDDNGNRQIRFTTTVSAVNGIEIKNAATGNPPEIYPVSTSDSNVDLKLSGKGTGRVTDSGVNIPTISSTDTLTNKRINKRNGTTTSSATPTINTDNVDAYYLTAQAVDITSFTTNLSGTPVKGNILFVSVIGTAARAITWGASFANGPVALPTTTVTTTELSTLFKHDGTIWRCYATGSTV